VFGTIILNVVDVVEVISDLKSASFIDTPQVRRYPVI
jgi:hypothetical protein